MERSEQIGELVTALAKAQAKFLPAVKDSANPYYNSKYADLATVITATRTGLTENGIAFIQTCEVDLEAQTASVCTSLHLGEQWIANTVAAPAVGKARKAGPDDAAAPTRFDVQTIGAAWTYLRRYGFQAIVGLASEDDDGNTLVTEQPASVPTPASRNTRTVAPPTLTAEQSEKLNAWREAFKACANVEQFKAEVIPLIKERSAEFMAAFCAPLWPAYLRALSTVDEFNSDAVSIPPQHKSREFIIAYAEEAKKRGYVGDRTTGLYAEKRPA